MRILQGDVLRTKTTRGINIHFAILETLGTEAINKRAYRLYKAIRVAQDKKHKYWVGRGLSRTLYIRDDGRVLGIGKVTSNLGKVW